MITNRKQIRLKKYDYAQLGYYFVTLCTQNRECLFGEIVDGKMVLNAAGNIIHTQWNGLLNRFHNIELDEYVVMPNHFHGIIHIVGAGFMPAPHVGFMPAQNVGFMPAHNERFAHGERATTRVGATTRVAPTIVLGDIVGAFKSITTNEYINCIKQNNWKPFEKRLWQRNYYEHIIRTEEELNAIRKYIKDNPQ